MYEIKKDYPVNVDLKSGGSAKGLFSGYTSLGSLQCIVIKGTGLVLHDCPLFIPLDEIKCIALPNAKEYAGLCKLDDLKREEFWAQVDTIMHEGLIKVVQPDINKINSIKTH